MPLCLYVYVYAYTSLSLSLYLSIHIYIYIYMYVYIYIYIFHSIPTLVFRRSRSRTFTEVARWVPSGPDDLMISLIEVMQINTQIRVALKNPI